MTTPLIINGANLTIENVVEVARFNRPVELSKDSQEKIIRCRKMLEDKIVARKSCMELIPVLANFQKLF